MVILLDGFRSEYLNRGLTPTLSNFRQNGVHSDYLKTVYPPMAYPAAHSIATGLYPENHGLMGKSFIRARSGQKIAEGPSMFIQNDSVPIWVLNNRNGGASICMGWPGQDASYKGGGGPCMGTKYNQAEKLKKRADALFTTLDAQPLTNLIMIYVEELDRVTHFFGPLSRNSTLIIKRLDYFTKYIINKLMEKNLYDTTNIFILSDHGMVSVMQANEVKAGERKYTYSNSPDVIGANARLSFTYSHPQKQSYINATRDFVVELKKKNKIQIVRIPPNFNMTSGIIEYAAAPGYVLDLAKYKSGEFGKYMGIYTNMEQPKGSAGPYGVHGYLRQNDAIFMAKGPNLATFKKVEPFEMVDLYSAFTRLLGIQGDFEHDGNYSRVISIFPTHRTLDWPLMIGLIFALSVIFTTSFCLLISSFMDTAVAIKLPVVKDALTILIEEKQKRLARQAKKKKKKSRKGSKERYRKGSKERYRKGSKKKKGKPRGKVKKARSKTK